jgi:hypothetical protein
VTVDRCVSITPSSADPWPAEARTQTKVAITTMFCARSTFDRCPLVRPVIVLDDKGNLP